MHRRFPTQILGYVSPVIYCRDLEAFDAECTAIMYTVRGRHVNWATVDWATKIRRLGLGLGFRVVAQLSVAHGVSMSLR